MFHTRVAEADPFHPLREDYCNKVDESPCDNLYNVRLNYFRHSWLLLSTRTWRMAWISPLNCHLHITLYYSTSSYFAALTDFNDTRPTLQDKYITQPIVTQVFSNRHRLYMTYVSLSQSASRCRTSQPETDFRTKCSKIARTLFTSRCLADSCYRTLPT